MLLALVLAAAMATAVPASPKGQALIGQMERELANLRARQAQAPPKDDAERLERLGELDQVLRRIVVATDFSAIPQDDLAATRAAMSALMAAVDQENQAALLAMLPPEGWFLRSRVGPQAARAAFNIVQHADTALQRRFLPVLGELVPQGEVEGQNYALMFDRVAVAEGRPQRYGSQFRCEGGRWKPYPLEDADKVDAQRAAMGMGGFTEMKARFEAMPPCLDTPPRRASDR